MDKDDKKIDDIFKDGILELIKDVKLEKGAVLNEGFITEQIVAIKAFTDDKLLINIAGSLGQAITFLQYPTDIYKIYGLLIGHFLMEKEAQDRELYW